jgi:ribonuclease BN (tRNA processing enzyme)
MSITYSGDTAPTRELVELARGTVIALFEASFVGTQNPPNLHLSGAEAARIASQADVGLLLLTHHAAWNDEADVLAEAVAEFDGPIEQARPGMTIDLS